jgi:DNA/RNA-binding domain of Phe-tRNA-synthetase-like protein
VSIAYAIPIAVFDRDHVTGNLEVRQANGSERYLTFGGDAEHPDDGEVIFADDAGNAHARRWTNRQSGTSAVRDSTASVLIVAEAMHETAGEDVPRLTEAIRDEVAAIWGVDAATAILSASAPAFST